MAVAGQSGEARADVAQIAYILLCHKDPDAVIAQAERLTAAGDVVAIHYDRRAPAAEFAAIRSALGGNDRVAFASRRIKCGWGEWSLVAATLSALRTAEAAFQRATHFHLISGDCMPIKSAEYIRAALDDRDADLIECFDFFESNWIKTGFKEERLVYRHWFNERTQKRLFYTAFALQKRLGIRRDVPRDLEVRIGSQWWCLRRQTVEKVLALIDARPDIQRFFSTTWIPDETFFQTLVRHVVPETEVENRTPTFLMFSDYGMPVTFYNDHYDLLVGQDGFFARKISPEATELKARLGALYAETRQRFAITNEGRRLYQFVTGRGRVGARYAPRFWEADATIGHDRSLMIVACKKWHVAKRLLERVGSVSNLPSVEYLFDEEDTALPDLGGIETTLEKRARHRRALVRMLFDFHETDRLMICLDPANTALFRDFHEDRCETRVLEIECRYSDAYLRGHARRIGLAGEATSEATFERLLPTIRGAIATESNALRDARFPVFERIREAASPEDNAGPLARFLGVGHDQALDVAATDYLFTD